MGVRYEQISFFESLKSAFYQMHDLRDSLFKNETIFKSIPLLKFIFYIILPNQHIFFQMPRTDSFFHIRQILMEIRFLILNFECMPWLEGFFPFIRNLTNIKKKIRDCEIISLNIDKLMNFPKRNKLENIRIAISILFAVIRLFCIDFSIRNPRNRRQRDNIYNEREMFDENNCPNCSFQNNLY